MWLAAITTHERRLTAYSVNSEHVLLHLWILGWIGRRHYSEFQKAYITLLRDFNIPEQLAMESKSTMGIPLPSNLLEELY